MYFPAINAQNWKMGDARFKPWSLLSTKPFRVFRGFLRNLLKYGLGSLKKTLHREHSSYNPRSHKRTIGLKTYNQQQINLSSNIFIFGILLLIKIGNSFLMFGISSIIALLSKRCEIFPVYPTPL